MGLVSHLPLDPKRRGRLLLAVIGLLLLTIQGTAIWGIVDARRRAGELARSERTREVAAQAATLSAALATLHGDLRFLVHSRPLARAPGELATDDPVARRWSRLELEGAVLLFLEAHPAVLRIYVERPSGELLAAAGWRLGSPVNLRRDEVAAGPRGRGELHESVWSLPGDGSAGAPGRVRVWIDPVRLLRQTLPAAPDLTLIPGEGRWEGVAAVVEAEDWSPPIRWRLMPATESTALLGSMQEILAGSRRTLLINLIILATSAVLGVIVLRQTRAAAEAAAEARHREERAELERQVQHSERLAAVGRLAAGVAHEINNPLTGIVNYLSLLRQELEAGDVAAAGALLERIREGTDVATEVVRQLLTFAEPGRGEPRPLDLASVAERTFRFVAANPAYRHLEFTYSAGEHALPVRGDGAALSQLILNLLLNACDAQGEGGEVELRLSRQGDRARIALLDRGPGLSAEAQEHLFEPFYSTRGSTGLGLSVCHGIVRAHGGSIRGANRRRGGASFLVELPLDAESPAATDAAAGDRRLETA